MISAAAAIKIDPRDNAAVALSDLAAGSEIIVSGAAYRISAAVAAKHKFACEDIPAGGEVRLYGVVVGTTTCAVSRGEALTTVNLIHGSGRFAEKGVRPVWTPPGLGEFASRTFDGYRRADGGVGTANHWIVIPMVFCENRNVDVMRQAMLRALGYYPASSYEAFSATLVSAFQHGASAEELTRLPWELKDRRQTAPRVFANVDGVQFLTHGLGCGGTREDARALCGLLAGYVTHPNVAGSTVLSLGCQNAEVTILEEEVGRRSAGFDRPLLVYEQQKHLSEKQLLESAIRDTFVALTRANQIQREPFPLRELTVGVECGASDGFSGISANPAIGHTTDLVVAAGGRAILSEFPELCGVEQELIDRCVSREVAEAFIALMRAYQARAEAVGSGFSMNPSPGNIRDGLITDAIKSAGAAKKGGTSPVVDVIDYPGKVARPGLTLLCTPGNDVESTTAIAGAHANLILFSTGLGTPTGNAVCPVVKISSNTAVAERHPDMIDYDSGAIIEGSRTIESCGRDLLALSIEIASGRIPTKAALLGQNDFLPWKRGVSL